ncbi:MAG TPA: UbiA family prenyltransferase [Dehalococcoidia bacterium]|nr:UbiA family prenyltransferase [Dehalococcoidia bacterium]
MRRTLAGWVRAAHAFPLAMVMALTALVGLASAVDDFDGVRFGLMLLGMLAAQLAIGWTNDYLDRDSDARHQPWKPVPSGTVDPRLLPWASAVAILVAVADGVALGPKPLALLIAGLGAGLAYNLGFKASRFSFVPFVVAFAALPLYVWTALDVFRDEFLWLYFVAWPLALAVHVANVLPDREGDEAAGRLTIAVLLGEWWSGSAIAAGLVLPMLFAAISVFWLDYDRSYLAARSAYLLVGMAAVYIFTRRRSRDDLVWVFRLVCLAGVIFVTGWLVAV